MTSGFPAEVTALGGGASEEEQQRPKGHPGLWALTFAAEAQRAAGRSFGRCSGRRGRVGPSDPDLDTPPPHHCPSPTPHPPPHTDPADLWNPGSLLAFERHGSVRKVSMDLVSIGVPASSSFSLSSRLFVDWKWGLVCGFSAPVSGQATSRGRHFDLLPLRFSRSRNE